GPEDVGPPVPERTGACGWRAGASAAVTPAAASPQPSSPGVAPAVAAPAPSRADPAAADVIDHVTAQLSAARPCWVTATVDGRRSIDRLLPAGERVSVDTRRETGLTVGGAGGVGLAPDSGARGP